MMKNRSAVIVIATCAFGFCLLYLFAPIFFAKAQSNQSSSIETAPLIFMVTIPKSGTHLLQKYIMLLTNKKPTYDDIDTTTQGPADIDQKEYFLVSHGFCSDEAFTYVTQNNVRSFFIYRDPRDQIVSLIHYIKKTPSHYLYTSFKDKPLDELIYTCIDNLPRAYEERLKWITCPGIYTTTFEKLVGSKGGGSDEQQITELKNIAHHMGIELSDEEIKNLSDQLFGGTHTFREGKIGSWRTSFTDEHRAYFKEHANQLLIDLGYETGVDW